MGVGKTIAYVLNRVTTGEERGIVTLVESLPLDDIGMHQRDYFGELPQLVTFRNPLGQVKRRVATLINNRIEVYADGTIVPKPYYGKYKVGDIFP